MEHLYNFEIDQIIFLQKNFSGLQFLFNTMNSLTCPTAFYLIFLPLLGGYDRVLFGKALLAGVLSEYVSILLKYYTHESRPYWWLPESQTSAYKRALDSPHVASIMPSHGPPLRTVMQNPSTCELSAGLPATELVFAAAILYVLGHHILVKLSCRRNIKTYVFAVYFTFLSLAVVAKMYLGTYFLHQLLVGVILGMFFGSLCSTNEFYIKAFNLGRNDVAVVCVSVFLFNFVMYWFLLATGVDPHWTVKMALEHCQRIGHIRPESLPTYSLVRSFALLLAFANALPIYKRYRLEMNVLRSMPMVWALLLAVSVLYHFIPRHLGVVPFYLTTLAVYLCFYYALLTLIPKYCCPRLRLFTTTSSGSSTPMSEEQKTATFQQPKQVPRACATNQSSCSVKANVCRL